MSKINLKKSSVYEFDLEIDGEDNPVQVVYKKDEENPSASTISATYTDGRQIDIEASLFTALHDALGEIDPYGFVFSDLDEDE